MMRTIFGVAVLAIAGLAGCASSGSKANEPVEPPPQRTTTRITTTGTAGAGGALGSNELNMTTDANVAAVTLEAPIEKVWPELLAVYEAIGIPTSTVDIRGRIVGNDAFKVRRRLGTVPLTRYIDCGSTQGMQSAETYEIVLNIHSRLNSPSPNNTTVTTSLRSSGRPVSVSQEYRNCTSTGALEARIGELLKIRLGT